MGGLWAPAALLPTGWSENVLLEWDERGLLTNVKSDVDPRGLLRAPGPVVCGMPNLHSHAFQRALVGLVQHPDPGADFWSWRQAMYRLVSRLTPDLLQAVSAWVFAEMVASGYTSVLEFHYLHRPAGADPLSSASAMYRAAGDAGIHMTLAPVLYRWSDAGGVAPHSEQQPFVLSREEFSSLMTGLRQEGRGLAVAPHSLRATTPDDIAFLLELADDDCPVHIHVSEQPAEVRRCLEVYGNTPIACLESRFGLSGRWGLVHATHATPEELELLDDGRGTLILCPTTEHDLGDGRFPLELVPEATAGIGSDSHVSVNPCDELRLVLAGMRASAGRRAVLEPSSLTDGTALWDRACRGARAVAGAPVGRLAAGFQANLLVLDAAAPAFSGLSPDQSVSAWVLSGDRTQLAEVWVRGRVQARRGSHVREADLAAAFREAALLLRA
ncbi:MAG: formimidoylglutamate deiminase [Rhodothermales bacterium]|nr:formimidoylglutamate deiminase [Rhodothermales bacterium]MBO6781649.1 formimidoylglutamate deiminase [Rhodothermales bacterium]